MASDPEVTIVPPGGEQTGDQIGPYRLLEQIGEGGFGVVWLAERREPMVQRVALKVIKPGMDSKGVIARFEQERQALAVMDHPNVAKVLDGGLTPSGRPYFVMEQVKGNPITVYADRQRLTINERLALFVPVCEAVQHAHMKGIIHRDLKPSNILVAAGESGGTPVVKVIDFGVAKAISQTLTEKTIFTERGQLIGTPEYMSPEQAEMAATDIDTRSDVYSLGVVLYELLSGTLPFDAKMLRSKAYAEMQRIIREEDPPKPSTKLSTVDDETGAAIARARQADRERIAGELRRELEWMPLKALRKDRTRRYASAESLGADVRRYLEGKPLEAAPESQAYMLRKFVRRNRVQVLAVSAVAVALVAGFGTALWQAREAAMQRDAAVKAEQAERERAEQLKKVSDFQAGMLGSIDTRVAGEGLMADLRERFAAALEKAGVPEAERGAQAKTLGDLLVRVNATDAAAAMIDRTVLKPAIKTIDDRFKDDPATDARLRQALADLYRTIGQYPAALPLQESALATRRRTLGDEHPDTLVSVNSLGVLLEAQGRLVEAEPLYREAIEKRRRILGADHPDTLSSIGNMGTLLQAQGKSVEAEPYYREALESHRRVLGEEHPDTLRCINNMGFLCRALTRLDEAEAYYLEALDKRRRVLGHDHPSTLTTMNNLGSLLLERGRPSEAESYQREVLAGRRRALGEEHPSTLISINNMGGLLRGQGKLAEAEPYYREALEKRLRTLGEGHPDTLTSLDNLGNLLREQERLEDAETLLRAALEGRRRTRGVAHPETIRSLNNIAVLLQAQGRLAEAELYFREALEKNLQVLSKDHPDTLRCLDNLGGVLFRQDRFAESLPFLEQAGSGRRRVLGPAHPDTLVSITNMASLLHAWGRPAEAEPLYLESLESHRRKFGDHHPGTVIVTTGIARLRVEQDRAQEAITLLGPDVETGARRVFTGGSARLADFLAVLGRARIGVGFDPERFALAEANLLEAFRIFVAAKDRGPTSKDTIKCAQALVDLYAAWDKAEPGKDYDAKAAEWQRKLAE